MRSQACAAFVCQSLSLCLLYFFRENSMTKRDREHLQSVMELSSPLAVTTRAQGAIIQHQRTKSGPGIKRVPSVAVPVFLRTELVHKNVLRRACVALGRKNQHRVPCPPFVTQQQPEYLFRRCGDRKFGFRSENSIIYVFGGIYGSKVP